MTDNDPDKKPLEELLEALTKKYQSSLDDDIEFAKLKEIYLQLKELKTKLATLDKLA